MAPKKQALLRCTASSLREIVVNPFGAMVCIMFAFVSWSMTFFAISVSLLDKSIPSGQLGSFILALATASGFLCSLAGSLSSRFKLLTDADRIVLTRSFGTVLALLLVTALVHFSRLDWPTVAALVLLGAPIVLTRSAIRKSTGIAGPASWASLHIGENVEKEAEEIIERKPWESSENKHTFLAAMVLFPNAYIERRVRHFDIGREVTNCRIVTDFHVGRLKSEMGMDRNERVFVPVWGLLSDDYARSITVSSGGGDELIHLSSARSQKILVDAAAVILAKSVFASILRTAKVGNRDQPGCTNRLSTVLAELLALRNDARNSPNEDDGADELQAGSREISFTNDASRIVTSAGDGVITEARSRIAAEAVSRLLYHSLAPAPIIVPTSESELFRVTIGYEVDTASLLEFHDAGVVGPINFLKKTLRQPASRLDLYLESGVEPKDSSCEVVLPSGSAIASSRIAYDSSVVKHEWKKNQTRRSSIEAFRSTNQPSQLPGSGPKISLRFCETGFSTDNIATAWLLFVLMFGLIAWRTSVGPTTGLAGASSADLIGLSLALPVSVITVIRLFVSRINSTVSSSTAAKVFGLYGGLQITAYYSAMVLEFSELLTVPHLAWVITQRLNLLMAILCASISVVRFARFRRAYI